MLAVMWAIDAQAQLVDWVTFDDWATPQISGSGSSSELMVHATFTIGSGAFSSDTPVFVPSVATVDDPRWPYDNVALPALAGLTTGGAADFQLRFDFTNEGGLPSGGSLFVGDLEFVNTTVEIVGLVDDVRVDVNWTFYSLTVGGENASPPSWNPMTRTLRGTVGQFGPNLYNAVVLVSDRMLGGVQFNVAVRNADGMHFNVTSEEIRLLPEPSLSILTVLGVGLVSVSRPRPKRSQG